MAIQTINSTDNGANSLVKINDNFTDLDTTKADLASPTFTGTPTLPTGTIAVTQSQNDNSTKIATTAYVDLAAEPTQFATTQVFSGTAPDATFTDLDLSSAVGATQRVVILKVTHNSGGTIGFSFRRNGDTGTANLSTTTTHTLSHMIIPTTTAGYYLVVTDTSGVVEWSASGPGITATITLEAYW